MPVIEPSIIQLVTANYFKISITDLQQGGPKITSIVTARHVGRYLERQRGLTYPAIARLYNCDHTTVIASVRHIEERLADGDHRYSKCIPEIITIVNANVRSQVEAAAQTRDVPDVPDEIDRMTCPTCGAPVIAELQRQIAVLNKRVDELQGISEPSSSPISFLRKVSQ